MVLLTACSNERPPDSIITSRDGTKYIVIRRQNMFFNGDRMFVVNYISKDPQNEKIRNKEFEDLYDFIAHSISPKSDYDYVALVASTKPRKVFGITEDRIFRDRKPFSEVMGLRLTSHSNTLKSVSAKKTASTGLPSAVL